MRLDRIIAGFYLKVTPETYKTAALMALALVAGYIAAVTFTAGIIHGFDAAPGEATSGIADLRGAEANAWQTIGDGSAFARVIWGPFHWIIVVEVWLAILGIQVGSMLPGWLEPILIAYARSMPWLFAAVGVSVVVRVIELGLDKEFVKR